MFERLAELYCSAVDFIFNGLIGRFISDKSTYVLAYIVFAFIFMPIVLISFISYIIHVIFYVSVFWILVILFFIWLYYVSR